MAKQGKPAAVVAAPAPKVRKVTGVKIRQTRDVPRYQSADNVPPLNLLTQQELIDQGYQYPFAIKHDFSKDKHARIRWKRVHSNSKGPTGGTNVNKRDKEIPTRLVVHVKNDKRKKDFVNTYTFNVTTSGVSTAVRSLEERGLTPTVYHYKGDRFTH